MTSPGNPVRSIDKVLREQRHGKPEPWPSAPDPELVRRLAGDAEIRLLRTALTLANVMGRSRAALVAAVFAERCPSAARTLEEQWESPLDATECALLETFREAFEDGGEAGAAWFSPARRH